MLIGREAERRAIERLVAGARVGTSGVLLITGEPGIGKTALVDEAAALAAGLRVLRARGTEAEQEIPFGGLLQLLRPALGELDRIPPPQRTALTAALALTTPLEQVVSGVGRRAPADRFAVGAASLSLICRYAESVPVAIFVDDAQWLDRASAEALLFTARRLVADPIVLVIAARSGAAHPLGEADLPQLVLGGVALDAARELVSDRALPVDLVTQVHQMVGGNPLALLELTSDPDQLRRLPPVLPGPVPQILADAFAARADRLSRPARTALLLAAVGDGDLGVVARACTDLQVDIAALAEAEQAALVTIVDGVVEFRHPLARSAIYASAAPAERRTIHRAVASAVLDADRRAWHLSEAVLGTDDAVAAALEQAAGHAVERGAHAVAATALERAARLTERPQDQAGRLVAAGEAAWLAGMPDRADDLLVAALERQPPLPVMIRAEELRADIAGKCGSPASARDLLLAAAARSVDPQVSIGLLSDVVNACFHLGDARTALRAAQDIEDLLTRVDEPGTRTIGLLSGGIARVMAGRGGAEQIREAAGLAPTAELDGDRRWQLWSVLAPLFLRDSATGRVLIHRAMRDRRSRVALGQLPTFLFYLARDEATTDRWADAASSYDEAIRLARETGQTTELAISLAGQAWLAAHRGQAEDCQTLTAEAIDICTDRQIHLGMAWSLFALGDLELGRGNPAAAVPQYERLLEMLAATGMLDPDLSPAPELVEAYLRQGRSEDAQVVGRSFARAAAEKGLPWSLARAARVTGLLGGEGREFEAALEWHAQTLDLFETSRTRLVYGSWLRRVRRRVDARIQLRMAVSVFDQLGARTWADLAAAELKATGETARRREASTADELTPQERQVALLLADGQSIRAAAAGLFLSPKTVEYHLRKVYNKLGIHSRGELAKILEAAAPD
jgi:DNA-binding CsgD family transcriptional regulator